jgi:hypothetical protein
MKVLTDEQKEVVRRSIRSIVDDRLSEMIGYDLEGSDFVERIVDNLPTDFNLDFEIRQGETTQFIDSELYHKFLDNVTDSIFNDLKFE